ncbi:TPA: ead/Ea22-like family protein [Escherichia coli]|nr:ead/Ea22-like family protein [Escherichia coli]
MTALNKQALREASNAANIASWGKWESYKSHKGARGYEVKVGAKAVAQHCLKVDSAFIAAANPATVLALLDELESAEKRIAEHHFENRLLANADRDIKALRQRIAELEAHNDARLLRSLTLVLKQYDDYGQISLETIEEAEFEIKTAIAAGIGVKEE